jgi:uncharacterized protein YkwD
VLAAVLLGGAAALDTPAASCAPPAGHAASRPPARPGVTAASGPESDGITAMEDTVTALLNWERQRAGCHSLRTDERMRAAARRHSADMARHGYFGHTGRDGSGFADRLADAGYPRQQAASENIAYGLPTAPAVVQEWLASAGHRGNILDCRVRATGVGLAYRGPTAYWTQDFGWS